MTQKAHVMHGRDHCPEGADPIPCLTDVLGVGDTFEDIVLGSSPDGLWKLDETSGTTAVDSSGNGRDLLVGANSAPTWAQTAGPPGTVTAGFSTAAQRLRYASYPDLTTGDFSCVGWAYYTDGSSADFYALMGQGTPSGLGGFNMDGWLLGISGSSMIDPLKAKLFIGDGSGFPVETVKSNSALTVSTWYQLAITRTSGTFRMYVNGVVQSATSSATITMGTPDLIFGSTTGSGSTFHLIGRGSWWAVYGRALSGDEILEQYTTATVGGGPAADWVWTAPGGGGAPSWQPQSIAVTF